MTLKRKMSWGLGFLFLIIFSLELFYSVQLGRLSQDAAWHIFRFLNLSYSPRSVLMTVRYFALVLGIIFLLVGILGFVPGMVQPPPHGHPT